MKRIIALCALASLLAACAPAVAEQGWESAADALQNMRIGWNLGNTLDSNGAWIAEKTKGEPSDYETAWGNPVTTPEIIQTVKDAGFGMVRVPVTYREHMDENGTIDEKWLDRVEEIVNYVLDEGLYCIINVHHDTGAEGWLRAVNDEQAQERFCGIWRQLCARFGGYGEKLVFEGFNELLDEKAEWNAPGPVALQAVNRLNQAFVDTVRASGGNNATRNLAVTTYAAGSSPLLLMNFTLPTDPAEGHLMVEVHSYDPWGFNSSEVPWTTMTDQWSDEYTQVLEKQYARLGEMFTQKGVPVLMGEFGNEDKNNLDQSVQYAALTIRYARENGVTCCYWDCSNFILLDRKTCTWLRPEFVQAMMNELP